MKLHSDHMPEAEVSLRLAFHLLRKPGAREACVAIDGAQVHIAGHSIFKIEEFLKEQGWRKDASSENGEDSDWGGTYKNGKKLLRIHKKSGVQDVVCKVRRKTIRAECKKGHFEGTLSNPELKLLREALGQLLTLAKVGAGDILIAAVPQSAAYQTHVDLWSKAPLVRKTGIRFALVSRKGIKLVPKGIQ